MLQETNCRLDFLKPSDIYIATNIEYKKEVIQETRPYKIPIKNIIIEPELRDTAPCIGLAATIIEARHPGEVMAIIYADHLIKDKKELEEKLRIAEIVAGKQKTLNIIEVKAKYPNVNLGYVKIGKVTEEIDGTEIFSFDGFREKPSLEVAKKFLASYKYLWNTGLYVWRTDVIMEYFKKHQPDTYAVLQKIKKVLGSKNEAKIINRLYPKCEKISIDYGIMEKVDRKNVRIIPAELGWSDIGTWESLHEELDTDEEGNLVNAIHIGLETRDSLFYGQNGRLIATIGIKNLVVVDTPDALLICDKKKSHDVKKLVAELKNSGKHHKTC